MDVFKVLGISQTADDDTKKRAYRKLCAKYHPDNAVTGDREKFDEVQTAWGILQGGVSSRVVDIPKKVFISHTDLFHFSIIYS